MIRNKSFIMLVILGMLCMFLFGGCGAGGGGGSDTTTSTTPTTGVAAPTGLTATADTSAKVDLTWTGVAAAVSYRIYQDGSKLKDVTQTAASSTELAASTLYCYTVSAFNSSGTESAQSSQVCATTYQTPPNTPTNLVASATSPTQVDLSWTASTGASQYKIYRNGVLLASATATTYSDTTVVANTQYTYTVTAIDSTGSESDATSGSSSHTGLTVPSSVTVTVNSSSQITVSWTNSGGALVTGYKVYKAGTLLGSVTATSLVDSGLMANTQYCYSVSSTSTAGGESAQSATFCGTTEAPPTPATVDLLVSSPQLDSDDATAVTLTAVVKDSSNRSLSGQIVSFTAGSGQLTVTSGTTGDNGTATATLGTGGNPANRTINLTAATGGITATNTVTVTGTTLSISGSSAISFGDSTALTITLMDSASTAIVGKTVAVSSANGNTLSATSYVTDNSGQVTVTVTATVSGTDTITASAMGSTKTSSLTVDPYILAFTSPAASDEISIGVDSPISVTYTYGGVAKSGVTVSFVTTRGTLSAASAVTNASGVASVTVSATNSGPVLLQASVDSGPSTQVSAEFVATTVNAITLQAVPNTIGTNSSGSTTEKSLISAVARDANDNLVKGKLINFSILNDASGGTLSPASATTDSSGTASTYFIAGTSTSTLDGVEIQGAYGTAVTATTTLTVAEKAMYITLGTGPYISALDDIRYQKNYVALVTDAAGAPIEGATVTATLTPVYYLKGYYTWPTGATNWQQVPTLTTGTGTAKIQAVPACSNEDVILNNSLYNYNSVVDTDTTGTEDLNANGKIDPGNVASVTAGTTDEYGHCTITIVYAKNYANWVNVKLQAHASTTGSSSSASETFILPGLASDYTSSTSSPPGNPSPFGLSTTCLDED